MSKDSLVLPESRTWRDIPQQVKSRAMSREGQRRLVFGVAKACVGTLVIGCLAWGAWEVSQSIRDPSSMPEVARSERIRSLTLVTDGVLDKVWLARTLALPADATLLGTDLMQLRSRVMADGQVRAATISRVFPDTLSVRISERSPVARLMAQSGDAAAAVLLISRDGVSFTGTGFDPAMVATLPWLDGVKLTGKGGALAPVAGMTAVADLLASAKLEAERLYRTWQVVSLARLATDSVIEVQTKDGMKVIFGTTDDYLRQIARLDLLIDASTDATRPLRVVDLSLGAQVPVAYGTAAPTLGERPPSDVRSVAPGPLITFPSFSSNQSASHRGL